MTEASLFSIAPFDWMAVAAALFCGFIIGTERQFRGKPVGIRTSTLIVLGTYIFTAAALAVSSDSSDPTRIIGQIVTGVGFLGAGVMLARDGVILGVTSAATIWVLASIGICIAVISTSVAIKFSLIVVAILVGIDILEEYVGALTRGVHAELRPGKTPESDKLDK